MKRFDYYAATSNRGYLLIVQSDRLTGFRIQVVVPLLPKSKFPHPTARLHPIFRIGDEDFVMATHLMLAIPSSELKVHIGSLTHAHSEIMNALDMLLTGI